MKNLLGLILIFCGVCSLYAQKSGYDLGMEYFKAGDYAKARVYLEPMAQQANTFAKVYHPYSQTLISLKEKAVLEVFYKKILKWAPTEVKYRIDYASFLKSQQQEKEAQKILQKLVQETGKHPEKIPEYTEILDSKGLSSVSKEIYLLQRKIQQTERIFAFELAGIYKQEGNQEAMVHELIGFLIDHIGDETFLKDQFQTYLTTEKELDLFETALMAESQKQPDIVLYQELLIWTYLQRKDFYKAYVYARAYDLKLRNEGSMLMQVGKIALENGNDAQAIEVFTFVCTQFKSGKNYPLARQLKIEVKEKGVKNTYPLDQMAIQSLIVDYKQLILELGKNHATQGSMKNLAYLYGFYAQKPDSAILILQEMLANPRVDFDLLQQAKLMLGDVYLIKGEPWESTLLYSQVEKSMKDQSLGHEAKLKNAKLAYYKGDFEWAQEQLDVLKLATSREIANDAMDLSLLIQDNYAPDTSDKAMLAFARLDFMIFQHQYAQALIALDDMLVKYPKHSLTDEIYFKKAYLHRKMAQYTLALEDLQRIQEAYKEDIYGDDAAYLLAQIYDEDLHLPEKAMEHYQQFLIQYPASIYTAEARKRFRTLRGDKLN